MADAHKRKKDSDVSGPVRGSPVKRPRLEDIGPEDDDEDEQKPKVKIDPAQAANRSKQCPYLDTINRHLLDFDFEKLCSVSLTRINVYACLVCGKYFQGRGTNTHAYTHSVAEAHHVFLNLQTLKFYCLPDNYEIIDSSLDDIKYVLNPVFSQRDIRNLDKEDQKMSRTVDGTIYAPGIVGMNNIKANDYCNVILQSLSHVKPIRDFFLIEKNYANTKRPPGDTAFTLVQRFGELLRKLWNPRNFKAHVSPHEMLQAVVLWSSKKFQITEQGDPIEFLSWFLHSLHKQLRGNKQPNSSVVNRTFLGEMKIYTRKLPPTELDDVQKQLLLATDEYQEKSETSTFLYLTCDLPATPLFIDEFRENIIPQVNLYQLLAKFNAVSEKEYKTYKENFLKRFEITRLPKFVILYIKRFTKNTFFLEKNPTIVNFPVKNIDFGDILTEENKRAHRFTKYNLVANIVHDGEPKSGTYRCHVLQKGTNQWYEMQDLHVTSILPQMITLTEAYIQIYEQQEEEEDGEGEEGVQDVPMAATVV
ncbi:U4/U6.U5 tri-snRNP-associated protein 2 [Culex quinquefasciatus]|uniref:U4/U6.U5 tri-snRNP-associated protein 2 n=1 Tax=Culex quinquefasciatus TaxID=7176 RepID=UPI0018E34EF1|nr:U4/U6.U5 tri-snRNP-associated protein 2 [Culex quinquefasciatus]